MEELTDLNDLLEESQDIEEQIVCNPQIVDEPIVYNKIYARINQNGVVIHIFSQEFEEPQETDICIDETNVDRHGAQKYKVLDNDGLFNYEIVNDQLVERNKSGELERKEKIEFINSEIVKYKEYLDETDYVVIKINEAQAYGDEEQIVSLKTEYSEIVSLRIQCRAKINELEETLKVL